MKKKIIIVLILIIIISIIGYFLFIKKDRKIFSQTFSANIINIEKNNDKVNLLVSGLDTNDINYRGNFTFSLNSDFIVYFENTKTDVSKLSVGDKISITFTDKLLKEISPIELNSITKIELLESVSDDSDITIDIKSISNTSADIVINDNSGIKNIYTTEFKIQKKIDNIWTDLKIIDTNSEPDLVAYYINENSEIEMKQDWTYMYGKLESGNYRIVKVTEYVMDNNASIKKDRRYIYKEFTID